MNNRTMDQGLDVLEIEANLVLYVYVTLLCCLTLQNLILVLSILIVFLGDLPFVLKKRGLTSYQLPNHSLSWSNW